MTKCEACGALLEGHVNFCPNCGAPQRDHSRLKYKDAEALRKACEAYFAKCDKEHRLYGEAGLCLHLDVTRQTLWNWRNGKKRPEFQETIQMADLRIQSQLESDPTYMEKGMVTKSIFMLKQPQFGGYQDKVEAKQDISVKVKMGNGVDESDFK